MRDQRSLGRFERRRWYCLGSMGPGSLARAAHASTHNLCRAVVSIGLTLQELKRSRAEDTLEHRKRALILLPICQQVRQRLSVGLHSDDTAAVFRRVSQSARRGAVSRSKLNYRVRGSHQSSRHCPLIKLDAAFHVLWPAEMTARKLTLVRVRPRLHRKWGLRCSRCKGWRGQQELRHHYIKLIGDRARSYLFQEAGETELKYTLKYRGCQEYTVVGGDEFVHSRPSL